MGQALSNVIKSIDGSADAEKQIQDSLNALFALGESRNDSAWAKATSDSMKVYAPISKVLLRRQTIVASAKIDNKEGVVGGIKGAVGNLMKGQILDGVTDIISSAMDVVLGASAGQVSSQYTYALVATDLGALLRIDVDIYSFELKSQGLQQRAKNMTAITSIISTINPQALTLSDIRGIVSLSYGNSPEDRQKQIFELVKAAWENDVKVASGSVLTDDDHANFQSHMRDSVYEKQYLSGLSSNHELAPQRVTRNTMMAAYKSQVAQNQAAVGTAAIPGNKNLPIRGASGSIGSTFAAGDGTNGTSEANGAISGANKHSMLDPVTGVPDDQMVDVFIWVMLTGQVDQEWISQMGGAISGFNVTGMLKYQDIAGGLSGNAVSFRIGINGTKDQFDLCIRYLHDSVLASIRRAEYLTGIISHMALQFDHPSVAGKGMITIIEYNVNPVTNNTSDDVELWNGSKRVCVIPAGGHNVLDGPITHIQGTPKAEQTEGDQPDATPAPKPKIPTQWVTYDPQPYVIHTVAMTLVKAGKNSGYLMLSTDGKNEPYTLSYNVAWAGGSDDE